MKGDKVFIKEKQLFVIKIRLVSIFAIKYERGSSVGLLGLGFSVHGLGFSVYLNEGSASLDYGPAYIN